MHSETDSTPREVEVTFLIYSPFPKYSGGRENWLHNLAPYLIERGTRVRVIAFATDRAPFYALERSGIEVVALPSVRYFFRAFTFLNRATLGVLRYVDLFFFYPIVASLYVAFTRPRKLICMNPVPEGIVALIARVPYVASVRGDVPKGLSEPLTFLERPLRRLESFVLRRARKVLANGVDTQQRLASAGIGSTVVPNGVDLAWFAEPAPGGDLAIEIERRARGRPVIAFIATIDEMHGATDAIDCAAELKERDPNFMLAMVGKGATGAFKSRAHALGLDGWVDFIGESSSVVEVLQKSSIFLGLSRGNGMSMSALEAMAAGVPMVARDALTYRQLIEDERSGLLGSGPKELADCCLRLLSEPETARTLGRAAQARARDYDWPRVAEIFLAGLG
ncbi:MAG TPA: glycosyltransferase family 4 protein [Candidatus Acidoferrum sp.]|nr:glycosyltransferase family 4 protein [Candidatus Acidoferrum sp.]